MPPGCAGAASTSTAAAAAAVGTRQAMHTRLAGPELSALWHEHVERLKDSCMPRTIIGIVGDTGAGGQAAEPRRPAPWA